MKYAVCVTFKIKPDFWHEFLPIVHANARTSLELEDDCLIFDVCTNSADQGEVFLYEIYTSENAFQKHLISEHYLLFDAKVAHMVSDKQVSTYSTVA